MVPKILFYSYKGGTGRSCAVANVATELAISGKKVFLIDLDIEGPSLKVIFDIGSETISDDLYVQDYLRFTEEENWPYDKAIINLKELYESRNEIDGTFTGELYFLPASESYDKTVRFHGDTVQRKIDLLLKKIEKQYNIDVILIDSPNGYGPMTQQAFFISDLIVVLFKWSKQHINGTSKISEIMRYLDIDYLPVASVVPITQNQFLLDIYAAEMSKKLNKDIEFSIPENDAFKWSEQCVMNKKNNFISTGKADIDKNVRNQNKNLVEAYKKLSEKLVEYI
ncbi:MAG: ParA family protein [Syntrophales bacterium]